MRIAAVTLATVLMLTGASVAGATPPEREHHSIEVEFVDDDACEGFDILVRFEGTIAEAVYRDSGGEVTRRVLHRRLGGSMTNLETGVRYPLSEADKVTLDPDGSASFTGSLLHVFTPDGRSIAVAAGHELIDADGNSLALHGHFDDLCAALT